MRRQLTQQMEISDRLALDASGRLLEPGLSASLGQRSEEIRHSNCVGRNYRLVFRLRTGRQRLKFRLKETWNSLTRIQLPLEGDRRGDSLAIACSSSFTRNTIQATDGDGISRLVSNSPGVFPICSLQQANPVSCKAAPLSIESRPLSYCLQIHFAIALCRYGNFLVADLCIYLVFFLGRFLQEVMFFLLWFCRRTRKADLDPAIADEKSPSFG